MSDVDFHPRVLRDREEGEQIAAKIETWWSRLVGLAPEPDEPATRRYPRATRSLLRRATSTDEALLTDGFRMLWFMLPAKRRSTFDMPAWACVAAVLAEVRGDDRTFSFAMAMGSEDKREGRQGTGKPKVSELRFQQLLRSADLDELMRRARRTVHLLGNKVHVLSLADSLLHWHQEKQGRFASRPDHRLAVRWANDYFSAMAAYQKATN